MWRVFTVERSPVRQLVNPDTGEVYGEVTDVSMEHHTSRMLIGAWETFAEANLVARFLTEHGVVCSTEGP